MQPTSKVLFLCSGNFYRSRFAEAYFNFHVAKQSPAWTAQSRGFRLCSGNVGPISPHAVAGLRTRRIPPPEPCRMPLVVSARDFTTFQRIVAVKEAEHRPMMLEKFPAWVDSIEYWQIHDLDFAQPDEALASMELQLNRLLGELKTRSS